MLIHLIELSETNVMNLVALSGPLANTKVAVFLGAFAGISPPYWVSRAYLAGAGELSGYGWTAAGGLAIHGVLLLWLVRRFMARAN